MKSAISFTARKKVLLVAFHFPPCSESSGIQRTLSFTKHLGKYGWDPVVLTVNPIAYEQTNQSQLGSIPKNTIVERSLSLDVSRHLSIRGRYWSRLAIPDRWNSWWWTAIPTGLNLIKKHKIDAIWSTYPITTAHNIAATLAKISKLPWVADFRDPMVEYIIRTNETYPKNIKLREARLATELKAIHYATYLIFCTDAARQIVSGRYTNIDSSRLLVIPNGYDEDTFKEAEQKIVAEKKKPKQRVLLHSGTIYPGTDRDPTPLLKAVRALLTMGSINSESFELRFRNPCAENFLANKINEFGVQSIVKIEPQIAYTEALAEMLHADGLLLLQGFTSNPAIPAKLYEYLRAQQPILGLVDPNGATAATLHKLGIETCDISDTNKIEKLIMSWLRGHSEKFIPEMSEIKCYSREVLTEHLAQIFNSLLTVKEDNS